MGANMKPLKLSGKMRVINIETPEQELDSLIGEVSQLRQSLAQMVDRGDRYQEQNKRLREALTECLKSMNHWKIPCGDPAFGMAQTALEVSK